MVACVGRLATHPFGEDILIHRLPGNLRRVHLFEVGGLR
jgi:hypothetical protein